MLQFFKITDPATPEFTWAWQLYEAAFPPEERRSHFQQQALLAITNYTFNIVKSGKEEVGILGFWQLENFIFLEHLAISSVRRGEGLGQQVLKIFLDLHSVPIILEVEPPVTELARRRVAFYERCGFQLTPYLYQQPPYGLDKPWVPLQLMSYPVQLLPETFEQVKARLYKNIYGQR